LRGTKNKNVTVTVCRCKRLNWQNKEIAFAALFAAAKYSLDTDTNETQYAPSLA